jgi:hypothetical protein
VRPSDVVIDRVTARELGALAALAGRSAPKARAAIVAHATIGSDHVDRTVLRSSAMTRWSARAVRVA